MFLYDIREGQMFWRKKKLKKSYSEGLTGIMVGLYGVIVSILQDELGGHYSIEDLKNAAAITVNKMVLRSEDRPDPSLSNDKLASLISSIKELTMIKEASSLVILFDYFISDKTDTARYEEAKKLGGPDFATINSLVDIDKASANKIQSIAETTGKKLLETASLDIWNVKN